MGRVQRQMQYYEKYLKNSATEVEKFSFREGVYLSVPIIPIILIIPIAPVTLIKI